MISRRGSFALIGCAGLAACGPPAPAPKAPSSPVEGPALRLDPLVDLVSGVGLEWLVQAKPRALLADDAFAAALDSVLPRSRLEALGRRYGGVDLRAATELVAAGYAGSTLLLARVPVDPERVETAFGERALVVEGRAVEHDVVRVWGTVGGEREQMAIFGREAVALEHGGIGALRPAVYFAQGKLRRTQPALRTEPLAALVARLGEAPLRGFAPGPFEGIWAAGLGGLLRATTAAAGSVRLGRSTGGGVLDIHLALGGDWGANGTAATERFAAAFQLLAQDPMGRLLGLDSPREAPQASAAPDALELGLGLDPLALARGLRAATGANLREILGLSAPH